MLMKIPGGIYLFKTMWRQNIVWNLFKEWSHHNDVIDVAMLSFVSFEQISRFALVFFTVDFKQVNTDWNTCWILLKVNSLGGTTTPVI